MIPLISVLITAIASWIDESSNEDVFRETLEEVKLLEVLGVQIDFDYFQEKITEILQSTSDLMLSLSILRQTWEIIEKQENVRSWQKESFMRDLLFGKARETLTSKLEIYFLDSDSIPDMKEKLVFLNNTYRFGKDDEISPLVGLIYENEQIRKLFIDLLHTDETTQIRYDSIEERLMQIQDYREIRSIFSFSKKMRFKPLVLQPVHCEELTKHLRTTIEQARKKPRVIPSQHAE